VPYHRSQVLMQLLTSENRRKFPKIPSLRLDSSSSYMMKPNNWTQFCQGQWLAKTLTPKDCSAAVSPLVLARGQEPSQTHRRRLIMAGADLSTNSFTISSLRLRPLATRKWLTLPLKMSQKLSSPAKMLILPVLSTTSSRLRIHFCSSNPNRHCKSRLLKDSHHQHSYRLTWQQQAQQQVKTSPALGTPSKPTRTAWRPMWITEWARQASSSLWHLNSPRKSQVPSIKPRPRWLSTRTLERSRCLHSGSLREWILIVIKRWVRKPKNNLPQSMWWGRQTMFLW